MTDQRFSTNITRFLGLILFGLLLPSFSAPILAASPPIHLLNSTAETVVIEFTLPDYALDEISIQGQAFIRLSASGMAQGDEPGAPQLPHSSALIALPPAGTAELRVLEIEQERVSLEHPLYPAPAPVLTEVGIGYEFALNETLYARDAFHPADVVGVDEAGWLRAHRLARVTFHPLRYNPARDELEITRRLVVEIRFNSAFAGSKGRSPLPSGIFDELLRGALLNYESARHWQAAPLAQLDIAVLNTPATQENSYKITVEVNGLYRLTCADLQAAGLPTGSLDPRTFQLFEGGQEVAIRVTGQDDGSFDSGDAILFYGRAPRSRYTAHNIYWLRYGDAAGRRMATRDATPGNQPLGIAWTTARWEENHYYDSLITAADDDHWYAADLRPGAGQTIPLMLMTPAATAPTATLRVRLAGYTASDEVNPDHHALFTVNGLPAGEWWWDGSGAITATKILDRSFLRPGGNTLTISLPGDAAPTEGVWLDTVEVDYPLQAVGGDEARFWGQAGEHCYHLGGFSSGDILLYEVSDPQGPVLLQGGEVASGVLSFADDPAHPATYLALTEAQIRQALNIAADTPSNLRDEALDADYLIITHADFAEAVEPLADHRRSQGLSVTVADVQDVYDEFGSGLIDPEAIRDFIARVLPAYVLLVGDGSYDFLDHFGYGPVNSLPPYLAMVDPWWGETAADNLYAAVVGDDPLPDVLLGRLPVTTAAEAETVVGKILNYEQDPWLGEWNARHVFVTDESGDFAASANAVYNEFITEPWAGQKIYLDDLPAETARQETLAAWNRGALLVSFVGHSSWHQWSIEALLDIHDVPDLRNDRLWPVLLSMTCFTGFFHHPEYGTLDESLLRLEGGGAVATFSPSGLGVSTGHDYLHQGFYQAVFTDGQTQLGAAILTAKLNLYAQVPAHADLLDTYHLFGDPAMALNLTIRPWPYSTFLPLLAKNDSGG